MSLPTTRLYVGCYTGRSDVGIHVFDADPSSGELHLRSQFSGIEHMSYLTASPDGSSLYAVSETDDGSIVAFRIDGDDGSLTEIDRTSSCGSAPCYVSTGGGWVYVANYSSGTVAARSLRPDGRFGDQAHRFTHRGSGPHPRQVGPHVHCIVPGPDGDTSYAADLGTDRVIAYRHDDATAQWSVVNETAVRPGAGPRHVVFHPSRSMAFVVGELDSTLVTLDLDLRTGRLATRNTVSTLPPGYSGSSIAADIHVHPNGRFLYVSNRGHDSIASFDISHPDRPPTPLGHVPSGGRTPRNFAIAPTGRSMFVANQESDTIVAFDLDPATGSLQLHATVAHVSEPVCLTFVETTR